MVEPWLPVDPRHLGLAVSHQQHDPQSVLSATARLLAFRRQQPALFDGDITLVDVGENLLGFVRESDNEKILCVFNMTAKQQSTSLPVDIQEELCGHGFDTQLNGTSLTLPAYQAAYLLTT